MAKTVKNASILQILVFTYFMIAIPAVLFSHFMVESIDRELTLHVNFFESGEQNITSKESTVLMSFGAFLRKYSMPFTNTTSTIPQADNRKLHISTENLYNARAAIIYCWIILISGGSIVYLSLVVNLHRIFERLACAIDSLRKHNLTQEIKIDGPIDMSGLSTSLENLRLNMSSKEEQQQRFLRHISHEIKTPLTSIKEGSKLLDDQLLGEINNEQQEITNILVRSSADLQRAVENLLDYNAAIALQQVSQRSQVDLSNLARQALSNNELSIKQKKLSVDAELEECRGAVDQAQILTIFDNLISNAIKHSPPEGTIYIQLTNNKSNEISFLIQDQGPGVKKQDEEFIFDPFYVGAQATKTTLKGTGLGLSIAKQYIDEHSGELTLLNSRKGATFKVVLPSNQQT